MEKLFLDKELVTVDTLTQNGVLAYVALRTIYNMNNTTDYVSVNRLAYSLIGEMDYETGLINALTKGLAELSDGKFITIRKDLSTKSSKEYILDLSNLHLDTSKDTFVIVGGDEVYKILTYDGEEDEVVKMDKKIRMLKYFIALISTFDNSTAMKCVQDMPNLQGKIGHMTQSYICQQANNSERTCQRYNTIFEDMKMVYIYKSDDYVCSENESGNNKLTQISNCYSRYADREVCEKYASNYDNIYGNEHKIVLAKKKKAQANKNRGLAQIYVQICCGNTDYDKETIKAVYKYITNVNKALQEKIDKKYEQKYISYSDQDYIDGLKEKIRETSIFEQFDFLNSQSVSSDQWGEPDPLIAFSVEEIVEMPTVSDLQSEGVKDTDCPSWEDDDLWETDSDLEGVSESFGISNSDKPEMDSQQFSQKSSTTDDLDLIDIESLFDEDTDAKPVLSKEEAWELFS